MPLSTYQNDSTCDLGAPLRPYSEKLPTRQPLKGCGGGEFSCVGSRGGREKRSSQRFFMKTGSAFMGLMKEKRIRAFGCEKKEAYAIFSSSLQKCPVFECPFFFSLNYKTGFNKLL